MATAQTVAGDRIAVEERSEGVHSLPVRVVYGFENAVLAGLLVGVFVVTLTAVAARFVFHSPLSWTIEAATTLMIWLAFIGLAVGIRDKAHVSFELLEDRFHGLFLTSLKLVQAVLMGFLLLVLGFGGLGLVQLGLGQVMPSGIPQWLAFAAVPVGCAAGLLHLGVEVFQILQEATGKISGARRKVA